MPIDFNNPLDPNLIASIGHDETLWRRLIYQLLAKSYAEETASDSANIRRINGTYTGTNQEVVPAPGAGKKIRVRMIYANAEDASIDVQFKSGTGTNISPNYDQLNNGGFVLPQSSDGWFETAANQALLVTTTGGAVDLLGTALIVDA